MSLMIALQPIWGNKLQMFLFSLKPGFYYGILIIVSLDILRNISVELINKFTLIITEEHWSE